MRIVFMGTPAFAVPTLEKLVEAGHEVVAVYTQPDRPRGRGKQIEFSPVKQFALSQGLRIEQPHAIRDARVVEEIERLRPEAIVVVAYGKILPRAVLDIPRFGCLNVHASLLPKYRGAAPIHWAIIRGETMTGVSIMRMNEGLDTGPVLKTCETPISKTDTMGMIHDVLKECGALALVETLAELQAGKTDAFTQDDELSSYAPLLTRQTERIDWTQSAADIHNMVRGLNPWPGAYTHFGGKQVKIWRTEIVDVPSSDTEPGSISRIWDEAVLVQTGCGIIALQELQPESKRRMPAKDFIAGYRVQAGEVFE